LERYLRVQIVNNAIREIFLNQFAHMFSVYEYFFNQPNQVVKIYTACFTIRGVLKSFCVIGYGFLAIKQRPSSSV
jgi:hypothetical protein